MIGYSLTINSQFVTKARTEESFRDKLENLMADGDIPEDTYLTLIEYLDGITHVLPTNINLVINN